MFVFLGSGKPASEPTSQWEGQVAEDGGGGGGGPGQEKRACWSNFSSVDTSKLGYEWTLTDCWTHGWTFPVCVCAGACCSPSVSELVI